MFKQRTLKLVLVIVAVMFMMMAACTWAKPEDQMEGVTELTDATFDSFIKSNKYVIVEFYAPWCGHCQQFAKTLGRLGKLITGSKRVDIKVAKVDGDKYESLANKVNLEGFPTLYLFKDGNVKKPLTHEGPMTTKGVLDFVYESTKKKN